MTVSVISAAAASIASAAECPPSIVTFDDHGLYVVTNTSDAAVYDSTFSQKYAGGNAHLTFDRTQGTLSYVAESGSYCIASIRVTERFDITGVPAGTPMNAVLVYNLSGGSDEACGASGCGVRCLGSLICGTDSVSADANQYGPAIAHRDLVGELTLPITIVAGSPVEATFTLFYQTFFGGGGSAQATGTYRIGLVASPAVFAVTCRGANVTPVRHSSWGAVKTSYR